MEKIPVIIIGCGPAACSLSFSLSRNKIRHLILEKELFPRRKTCGDACTVKVFNVLSQLRPNLLDQLTKDENFLPYDGVNFYNHKGLKIAIPHTWVSQSEQFKYFTFKRYFWDSFLFDHLNSEYCTVVQEVKIDKIQEIHEGFRISYTDTRSREQHQLQGAILIGADGDKGITKRHFLRNNQVLKSEGIAVRAYFKGVQFLERESHLEFHFLKETYSGYLWVFPMSGQGERV